MIMEKRKHPRLDNYDYSRNGMYFVTVCAKNKKNLFGSFTVGRGLAPAENPIELNNLGKLVEQCLLATESRYQNISVDKYVIMPNHLHAIIRIEEAAGASPRPTLMDAICSFKSIATRECNKADGIAGRQIFQTSFYEHIIRTQVDYNDIWYYIDRNPLKWLDDELYIEYE